jgi:uncharacterized membrane protein YgcG
MRNILSCISETINDKSENINEEVHRALKLNPDSRIRKPKTKKERIAEIEAQMAELQKELDQLKPPKKTRSRSSSSSSSSSSYGCGGGSSRSYGCGGGSSRSYGC